MSKEAEASRRRVKLDPPEDIANWTNQLGSAWRVDGIDAENGALILQAIPPDAWGAPRKMTHRT